MGTELILNPVQPFTLILLTLLGSSIWFQLYYFSRKIFSGQSAEFSSRIIACSHAIVMIVLCFVCIHQGPSPLYGDEGGATTPLQKLTMLCSLGYFVYDLIWCLYYQTEPIIMLLHHLASVASLVCILGLGQSGAEAVVGLGSMEMTNPLLQARWFLRTCGYNGTAIHTFVEWLFIITFILLRLVYGSRLTYTIMTSQRTPWQVKTCTGALFLISIIFIYHIFEFIKKKYIYRSDTHCPPILCESECKMKDN